MQIRYNNNLVAEIERWIDWFFLIIYTGPGENDMIVKTYKTYAAAKTGLTRYMNAEYNK